MEKEHEELILPDEYGSIMGGNADTSSDAHFGDFIYAQEKVGNTTRMTRRAILTDQITPDPFPENIADPKSDPDRYGIMEDPMNGTMRVDPNMLPPLQKKIDEAEAILKGCSSKNKDKESIDQNTDAIPITMANVEAKVMMTCNWTAALIHLWATARGKAYILSCVILLSSLNIRRES